MLGFYLYGSPVSGDFAIASSDTDLSFATSRCDNYLPTAIGFKREEL
jgi:predicted nucleotidyltransferase